MTTRVALIGAGAMGGAIGMRLLETGHQLTVFDPDKAKIGELEDKGAKRHQARRGRRPSPSR